MSPRIPRVGTQNDANSAASVRRAWLTTLCVALGSAILVLAYPAQGSSAFSEFTDFFVEMLTVMPAVFVIMGLFAVWVPKEAITRHLGSGSGVRGMAMAILIGMLPTGPLYVAFPMVRGLLDKGASPANMFAFTAAWACIKIPQELIEMQFLGWRFALARLLATIVIVVAVSGLFARLYGSGPEGTRSSDV